MIPTRGHAASAATHADIPSELRVTNAKSAVLSPAHFVFAQTGAARSARLLVQGPDALDIASVTSAFPAAAHRFFLFFTEFKRPGHIFPSQATGTICYS